MESQKKQPEDDSKAQIQALIEKIRPTHPKEAAMVQFIQMLADIDATKDPSAMVGPSVEFDNRSPDRSLDLVLSIADEEADDIAQMVPMPTENSYVTFSWQYVIEDARQHGGLRGYGTPDGRILDRGNALQLYANLGDFREMPLAETLDPIPYLMMAVNREMRTPNTYGTFDYVNNAYVETILHGQMPESR